MAVVTMKQLLDSGAHFGHQTRRWNPKMKRFIFTDRNGIYIIDLQQTLVFIDRAFEFVKETVGHGGTVMFIGTKKQAQESIAEQATRVGMPYVNQRWLGGMLTNFQTVHKRLLRLKELESMEQTGGFEGRTKKEILMLTREMTKLARTLGGIRDMAKVPSAVWIVDTNKEHLAVAEARKLKIPVVAILDTNCDPDLVDYPLPGNDDAIRSAALLTKVVATAVAEGLQARAGRNGDGDTKPDGAANEPLAEWEQELLAGNADAAAATTDAAAAGAEGAPQGTGAPTERAGPDAGAQVTETVAAATEAPETAVAETAVPETPVAEAAIGGASVADGSSAVTEPQAEQP
jgi:small subunit ribosomal protein S2